MKISSIVKSTKITGILLASIVGTAFFGWAFIHYMADGSEVSSKIFSGILWGGFTLVCFSFFLACIGYMFKFPKLQGFAHSVKTVAQMGLGVFMVLIIIWVIGVFLALGTYWILNHFGYVK